MLSAVQSRFGNWKILKSDAFQNFVGKVSTGFTGGYTIRNESSYYCAFFVLLTMTRELYKNKIFLHGDG